MSTSVKKTKTAAPAKSQKAASAPKAASKAPAVRVPAKTPAVRMTSREAMLARVEAVRLEQRSGGNFDCFGRAGQGYCDQGACAYHAECLSVSRLLHSL